LAATVAEVLLSTLHNLQLQQLLLLLLRAASQFAMLQRISWPSLRGLEDVATFRSAGCSKWAAKNAYNQPALRERYGEEGDGG